MAKDVKQNSVTKIIKRSQIRLNPYNPKEHSDEEIKEQVKNLRKVGYLGGIQWNEHTGNLIDGHRRLKSYDIVKKYDGTPATDYDIKVEAVDFDEKTELEQMTYEAFMNTRGDYNKVAKYLNDIDPKSIGFSDDEIKQMEILRDDVLDLNDGEEETLIDDIGGDLIYQDKGDDGGEETKVPQTKPMYELPVSEKTNDEIVQMHEEKHKMTKEDVKEQKKHCENVAQNKWNNIDRYILITFDTIEQKQALCDLLGLVPTNDMQIKGDDILRLIE